MSNFIKYLFILILMLGAVNYAAAQAGGRVLASSGGKTLRQADVDRAIEFYEWAFQTEFTAEQRARFRELKAEEFRNDPTGSKKGDDDLNNIFSQVRAKSRSDQETLRRKFTPSLISGLRKATGDEQAQMLVGIYDSANGGENSSNENTANAEYDNNDGNDSDSDAIGDLSSVAGKWVWQNSGSGTWNSATGAYMGGSGTRTTYEFAANGAVVYSGIMNTMMGGCSQQVFLKQTGSASVSGNTMTIKWSPGTSTRDYSCDRAGNYTRTAPALTENFPISFKTNSTGQRLLCIYSGSKETCFSPSR